MTDLLFDKKDIITAVNREDAEMYINTEGYYCYRFNDWMPCVLKAVNRDEDCDVRDVFTILARKTLLDSPMFLPADKVKTVEEKKETKWRPFTLEEFNEFFEVGDVITFRARRSNCTGKWLYQEYSRGYDVLPKEVLYLGSAHYSLQKLFNNFEYQEKSGAWNLFGLVD